MDKKLYRKTRYQNIYKNTKNGNYIISLNTPIKTSISKDENERKIYEIKKAIEIRDNVITKNNKKIEIENPNSFDYLWEKYMYDCEYVKKFTYNTINRKNKDYSCHLKGNIKINIHRADKDFWVKFVDDLKTTNKQKNHIFKQLRAFYNWMKENKLVANNPIKEIAKYKVEYKEMKFWVQEEVKTFFDYINNYIITTLDLNEKARAYMIKILVLCGFALGDRIGETRALLWPMIDFKHQRVIICHSIEYDPQKFNNRDYVVKNGDTIKSIAAYFDTTIDDIIQANHLKRNEELKTNKKIIIPPTYLKTTKNDWSSDYIVVSEKFCNELEMYKKFLEEELHRDLKKVPMIFWNTEYNRPYSDVTLRKHFHKYCRNAGVPEIRMYDLRHTFAATMMAEGKALYQIQGHLRHRSYKTTVDVYGHLAEKYKKEISETTDNYY